MVHLASFGAKAFKMTGDSVNSTPLLFARNYEPFILDPKPNTTDIRIGIKHRTSGQIIQTARLFGDISINGTIYGDAELLFQALSLFLSGDNEGVATGEVDAILSDTIDLVQPGWMQPLLLEGTVKYTTEEGETSTRAMDLKEVSPFKVRRVWLTGTTVGMGIRIIY